VTALAPTEPLPPPAALAALAAAAIERRRPLLAQLHDEGTDAYRLLHGTAEGIAGVTLDRYGSLLLAQSFRAPLDHAQVTALQTAANAALEVALPIVHNHRGAPPPAGHEAHVPDAAGLAEHVCHEADVQFVIQARHRGQDPWLFLDLRAGRRLVREVANGRSVLNLFAYTCGVGLAAAAAGAALVHNVDFAPSALAVGEQNARRNGIDPARFATLRSDCLPVLRQLAGQPVQRQGKHVRFLRIERRTYDLIVLDPPRFAKGPFGTVDVVRDYGSLWKPCLLALAPGGGVLATNHVPEVSAADWHAQLHRIAEKAGRPLRSLRPIPIDADFPSFDGNPPLKVVFGEI
jgi:23S rRNA (cytosine1962-C5)-methyltransferase